MAILFREKLKDTTYEVRTAGASRRLYTNGAFHTQYNPNHLFTGAVWDLLSLPALCLDRPPGKILVLGVAGGTVIHQMQKLCQPVSITGIELDQQHLSIGRRFFDLAYDNLTLVHADARTWLETSEETFDYIVDDIFLHAEGDPARPFAADQDWYQLLGRHLACGGTLVQNHVDKRNSRLALTQLNRFLRKGATLAFTTDKYENQVLAWFKSGDTNLLRKNLARKLESLPKAVSRRLRHDCQRFSE